MKERKRRKLNDDLKCSACGDSVDSHPYVFTSALALSSCAGEKCRVGVKCQHTQRDLYHFEITRMRDEVFKVRTEAAKSSNQAVLDLRDANERIKNLKELAENHGREIAALTKRVDSEATKARKKQVEDFMEYAQIEGDRDRYGTDAYFFEDKPHVAIRQMYKDSKTLKQILPIIQPFADFVEVPTVEINTVNIVAAMASSIHDHAKAQDGWRKLEEQFEAKIASYKSAFDDAAKHADHAHAATCTEGCPAVMIESLQEELKKANEKYEKLKAETVDRHALDNARHVIWNVIRLVQGAIDTASRDVDRMVNVYDRQREPDPPCEARWSRGSVGVIARCGVPKSQHPYRAVLNGVTYGHDFEPKWKRIDVEEKPKEEKYCTCNYEEIGTHATTCMLMRSR